MNTLTVKQVRKLLDKPGTMVEAEIKLNEDDYIRVRIAKDALREGMVEWPNDATTSYMFDKLNNVILV